MVSAPFAMASSPAVALPLSSGGCRGGRLLSPSTSSDERRSLEAELVALRDRPDAWRWALETLFTPTCPHPRRRRGRDRRGGACSGSAPRWSRRCPPMARPPRRRSPSPLRRRLRVSVRPPGTHTLASQARQGARRRRQARVARARPDFDRLLAVAESNQSGASASSAALARPRRVRSSRESRRRRRALRGRLSGRPRRARPRARARVARRIIVQTLPDARLDADSSLGEDSGSRSTRSTRRRASRRRRRRRRVRVLRRRARAVGEAVSAPSSRVRGAVRDAASHAGVFAEDEDGPTSRRR